MADRMHAIPEDMLRFSQALNDVNFTPPSQLPASVAGGMNEGGMLHAAMERAGKAARDFMSKADNGFTSFQVIATTCSNDYNANDEASALNIARTSLATTEQTRMVDSIEQYDHIEPGPGRVD